MGGEGGVAVSGRVEVESFEQLEISGAGKSTCLDDS